MSIDHALGWQITVERPGDAVPQVYNVAISDDHLGDAVKRLLPDAKGAVLKVTGELTVKVFTALRMKSGDVLAGAQPRSRSASPKV